MTVFFDGFAKTDNSFRYHKQENSNKGSASPMNPEIGKTSGT
jgi:hypothetical protein